MLKTLRFNVAWDATRAANGENNTYPLWLLKLVVAIMGYRLGKTIWGDWEFSDKEGV